MNCTYNVTFGHAPQTMAKARAALTLRRLAALRPPGDPIVDDLGRAARSCHLNVFIFLISKYLIPIGFKLNACSIHF